MRALPAALKEPDPAVNIRPVRLTDVSYLHESCWPQRAHSAVYQMILRALRSSDQRRGLGVVALSAAQKPIAYGQLTLWPRCGELSDLIVAPDYRERGIGTGIIQYLSRTAREMHVNCLEIGAARSNPRAAALYRHLGFEDSHEVLLDLGHGQEPVLYLRLEFGLSP